MAVNNRKNKKILENYRAKIDYKNRRKIKNVILEKRLRSYQYYDMYNMIKETLEMEKQGMKKRNKKIRKRGKNRKTGIVDCFHMENAI